MSDRILLNVVFDVFTVQTEMTAEERRKKHQLELKEQLHEEAKVCKTTCLLCSTLLGILPICSAPLHTCSEPQ